VAVGTILPTTLSSGESLPSHSTLGLQIQESLITFATQAGLKVIEYKTMPNIKISEKADKMLSRRIDELDPTISADYFLTGTYTLQENSTIVNIRLIQVPENIVLAAATDYLPNDVMWSASKVTLKNNQIYRNGY
jgi:TolB-like protein